MVNVREVRDYWNGHVMGTQFAEEACEVGSREYFAQIYKRWSRHEWVLRIINEQARSCRGNSLLEVGCGMGFDSAEWIRCGLKVTTIDLTESSIQMARLNFGYQGLPITPGVASGLSLPFDDSQFEVVYSKGVLHVTSDPQKAVDEVYRVLKPGGKAIILNLYNKFSWFVLLHKLGRENIEFQDEDAPSICLYSTREIRTIFQNFVDVEVSKEHLYPFPTPRQSLKAK